jgi:TolB-like protein/tetratricopeptide (TPR) repeat protein
MKREGELLDLIAAVVDGGSPDWTEVDSRDFTEEEREFVRNLRLVAGVSEVHRTHAAEPGTPDPAEPVRAGQRWGRFELLERIGEGGFGEVYRARDPQLHRTVAVKVLKRELASEEQLVNRVLTEGRALAALDHPNIVKVYEADVHEGRAGLCMEYVQGRTLEEQLAVDGPFGAHEATLVGQQVCRALAAVHMAGQVHRDVKPRNVMRAQGGRVVLMDFGAGLLPGTSDAKQPGVTGTPLYLAPELLAHEAATPQTDVYAVGVLLFHLVTRAYPVTGASLDELRDAHRRGARRNLHDLRPDLGDKFVQVVERAIAPKPGDRFATAGAMLSALTDALGTRTRDVIVSDVAVPARVRRSRMSVRSFAIAAGLLVVVVGAGLWRVRDTPPAPAAGGPIRLAVLPLRNLTGGPDWRVDAVTDDLMTSLGSVPGMQVSGWTSVFAVAKDGRSVGEIGKALNVTWLIEGSVRPTADSSDQAVVTIRLLHAGSGAPEWTATFTKRVQDLFTVAREVASEIPGKIGMAVVEARTAVPVEHSQNIEARDAYLQARFLMRNLTRENLLQARELLETAIRLDPDYAQAYAALAKCFTGLEAEQVMSLSEARSRALPAVNRALDLNSGLAEAHSTLGDLRLLYETDWSGAEAAYRRSVELAPGQPVGREQFARYLAARGRIDEAIREARIAAEADPLSAAIGTLAIMMYYARRHDEAIALFQRRAEAMPGLPLVHFSVARAYAANGQFDAAIRELQRAIDLRGGPDTSSLDVAELARTYAQAGRVEEARRLLGEIERGWPETLSMKQEYLGYIYAALGDKDRAFSLFNNAIDEQPRALLWARVDPRLDSVRDDQRYVAMLQRLGLTP